MEMPPLLKIALENVTNKYKLSDLKETLRNLTDKYMSHERKGDTLLNTDIEAVAYANVRMAATYNVNYFVLKEMLSKIEDIPRTVIDLGAGTGSASFAANELISLNDITCLEKEDAMMKLGKTLTSNAEDTLKEAKWEKFDVTKQKLEKCADLIIASYMINELRKEDRIKVACNLYEKANKVLVIIEPGTKDGFKNIRDIRDALLKKGANIVAPCMHENKCMINEDDWCHFSTRLQRSKTHKYLKDADAAYEDEKYSYIIFSKEKTLKCNMRIMRHPVIEKNSIILTGCTKDGIITNTFYKKDENYKSIKKLKCGESF